MIETIIHWMLGIFLIIIMIFCSVDFFKRLPRKNDIEFLKSRLFTVENKQIREKIDNVTSIDELKVEIASLNKESYSNMEEIAMLKDEIKEIKERENVSYKITQDFLQRVQDLENKVGD